MFNPFTTVFNFIMTPKRALDEATRNLEEATARAKQAREELRISQERNAISRDKSTQGIVQLSEALQRYIDHKD